MRTLGGSNDSSPWVHATHMGDLDWVLGYWLQPGPALVVMGIRGVNQGMKDVCVCVCVYMSFK